MKKLNSLDLELFRVISAVTASTVMWGCGEVEKKQQLWR